MIGKGVRAAMAFSVLACAAPGPVRAEPWSGEAALGVLTTSGNSETRSINAKLGVDYTRAAWKNVFAASAINAADSGTTTTERYQVTDQLDWNFTERRYAFGALEFEKDRFGGILQRTSETAGYGYRWLLGPVHALSTDLGVGARQTEEQDTGRQENEAIGRAGLRYQWAISDTSSFLQTVKVESGESNTFTESVSELKLSVVGPIFVGLSFTLRNNTEVPADTESTDTFTAVNLSYSFGKN